jgi:hypothetical protein
MLLACKAMTTQIHRAGHERTQLSPPESPASFYTSHVVVWPSVGAGIVSANYSFASIVEFFTVYVTNHPYGNEC